MLEERRYSKRELARLYYPGTEKIKSALKNLRTDIHGCPELVEELNHRHWNINKLQNGFPDVVPLQCESGKRHLRVFRASVTTRPSVIYEPFR